MKGLLVSAILVIGAYIAFPVVEGIIEYNRSFK